MLPRLEHSIRTHALFRPGERVGVAVSGGADSVALLRGLLELRADFGIVLSVVHLHHGIRGEEADADAQFVTDLAKGFDLPLHLEHADVPAHQRTRKLSLETAARNLRYVFFRRLLESDACDKIATAHTLDDQAETVLLRLLRGTGTRGLAAIPPFRNATPELAARIVRPMLGITRSEIEAYLHSLNEPWREDSTNADPKHLRNRVRHQLLPLLEREYNPALRHALVNLAEIARAEEEHWSAELAHHSGVVHRTADATILDRDRFLALPLAIQRRLLLDVSGQLDLPVAFDDIEFMLHIARLPGSQHTFEAGWLVASTKTDLAFRRATPAALEPFDLDLPIPGAVSLPNRVRILITSLQPDEATRYNSATLLDYTRLELPLRLRNWQPGDRFWPAGSKQAEKLKRLFQEQRVPVEARTTWPVVLSGSNIVWVRGFPVATGYAAHNSTAVLIEALDPGESRQE
jgi:tRNA(Ile)-lysidine synthase